MTRIAALLVMTALGVAAPARAQEAPPLTSLDWMAGCWERRAGDRVVEEQWMRPRGSIMLGMSRTTFGDAVREYEQLAIRGDSGTLVYAARPSGQEPAEFTSTHVSADSVVFVNPAHDFPQTIAYRTAARGDSLIASVAGPSGDGQRVIHFPYARARCPG